MHKPSLERAAILQTSARSAQSVSIPAALAHEFSASFLELADQLRQVVYKDFVSALYGQILTLRAGQLWRIGTPHQFPQPSENILASLFNTFSQEFSMIERDSEGFIDLNLPETSEWPRISQERNDPAAVSRRSTHMASRNLRSLVSLTVEQIAARYARAITIPNRPVALTQIVDYSQEGAIQYHFPIGELHPELVEHFERYATHLTGLAPGIHNLSQNLPLTGLALDFLKSNTLTTYSWALHQNLPTDFQSRQSYSVFQSLPEQAKFLHKTLHVDMARSALCLATYNLLIFPLSNPQASVRLIGSVPLTTPESFKELYAVIEDQYRRIQAGEVNPGQIDFDASVRVEDFEGIFSSDWFPPSRLMEARRIALSRPSTPPLLRSLGIPVEELNYWMINLLDQQAAAIATALEPLSSRATWDRLSSMTLLEVVQNLRPRGIVSDVTEIKIL